MSTSERLKAYVPPFVREDPMMAAFYEAVAPELDALVERGTTIPEQIWPHMASWAIDQLEAVFGLPVSSNSPLEQRRSALIARLRGAGTSTVEHIQGIASSYSNGEISVVEDFDGYRVEIEFLDELGVPVYLDDLKAALRAAVPAHLVIDYVLRWTTWGEVKDAGLTWGDLANAGVTWEALKTYNLGG